MITLTNKPTRTIINLDKIKDITISGLQSTKEVIGVFILQNQLTEAPTIDQDMLTGLTNTMFMYPIDMDLWETKYGGLPPPSFEKVDPSRKFKPPILPAREIYEQ